MTEGHAGLDKQMGPADAPAPAAPLALHPEGSKGKGRGPAKGHGPGWQTVEQEHEAIALGMWVFLTTEVLLFGGLITAYIVYRSLYPQAFAEASRHLNVVLASINTVVLLSSSLTMALAVHAAQLDKRRALVGFLVLTMLLGSIFLGIKAVEYYLDFQEKLVPALNFAYEGPNSEQVQLFFILYFLMTGLHAIHLTIGIAIVGVIALLAWRHRFAPPRYMPVEVTGLYWHFVDIVWVFLFPLLYLMG